MRYWRPISTTLCLATLAITGMSCGEDKAAPVKAQPEVKAAPDTTAEPNVQADTQAPTWPDGAALSIAKIQPQRLTVLWPPASDDQIVTQYRIYRNSFQVLTVTGGETKAVVLGLDSATQYTLSVLAEDAA